MQTLQKRETFKGRFNFTERKQTLRIIERLLRGKTFSTEILFDVLLFCFNGMSQRTSFNTCGLKVLNHSEIFVLFYKYLKKNKKKIACNYFKSGN